MQLFKTSETWVVDFLYEGRARRWFKVFRANEPVQDLMSAMLQEYRVARQLLTCRRAELERPSYRTFL